ncbi:MAG: c-type cytochrome [Octadecabacter sp.]
MRALWLAPLALAGCVEEELDVGADAGAALFQSNCAACHGVDARGMGDFGQELFTMPPDLTVLAADNGGVFPTDYVLGVIDGFHRDPAFSAAMPEFGADGLGPTVLVEDDNGDVTPIPARLLALGNWLESVQR